MLNDGGTSAGRTSDGLSRAGVDSLTPGGAPPHG